MGIRTQALRAAVLGDRPPTGPATRLRDRFELLVPLGSGGFGTVWEGFDMLLERAVAIKELPVDGELSDANDALREARATARLNHPAIVSLYEIVAEPDRIYMISELAHGCTLDEMIDERLLSDEDVARIGLALCEALAHAHAHGVVHRDVKPANVIVSADWIDGAGGRRVQPAKLMDFGIASIVDREGAGGPHAGSRGYMSPEQEEGEPASAASDTFSLALVLFECFTGALPRGGPLGARGGGPGSGRGRRLTRSRRDLPPELARCIDRCLETDPGLRPELSELDGELVAALPTLSDELNSRGLLARLRRRRRARDLADSAVGNGGNGLRARPSPPVTMRLRAGCAVAAGLGAVLTLLAAGMPLSGPPVAVCVLAAGFWPRAGWAVTLGAGVVALATRGDPGTALLLVLPAVCALLAAVVFARSRVLAGALWGMVVFLWLVTLQTAAATPLVLTPPEHMPAAIELRSSAAAAVEAMTRLSSPAYAASLALWATAAAIATILWLRGSRLFLWSLLTATAIAAQVALGSALGAIVPPLTLVTVPLAAASALMLAAAVARRTGRVFGAS